MIHLHPTVIFDLTEPLGQEVKPPHIPCGLPTTFGDGDNRTTAETICCARAFRHLDEKLLASLTDRQHFGLEGARSIIVAVDFRHPGSIHAGASVWTSRRAHIGRRPPDGHGRIVITAEGIHPYDGVVRLDGLAEPDALVVLPYPKEATGDARIICRPRRPGCVQAEPCSSSSLDRIHIDAVDA